MSYDDIMKETTIIGSGNIPEGYFGDTIKVQFGFYLNKIIAIHSHGFLTFSFYKLANEKEAKCLLKNHIETKSRIKNLILRKD